MPVHKVRHGYVSAIVSVFAPETFTKKGLANSAKYTEFIAEITVKPSKQKRKSTGAQHTCNMTDSKNYSEHYFRAIIVSELQEYTEQV